MEPYSDCKNCHGIDPESCLANHPIDVIEIDDDTAEAWIAGDLACAEAFVKELKEQHAAALMVAEADVNTLRRELQEFRDGRED